MSVLASGYAELGDFERAIEYAQLTLALAPEEEKPERARRIEQYYNRQASVVHPPVDTLFFRPDPSIATAD